MPERNGLIPEDSSDEQPYELPLNETIDPVPPELLSSHAFVTGFGQAETSHRPKNYSRCQLLLWALPNLFYLCVYLIQIGYSVSLSLTNSNSTLVTYNLAYGILGCLNTIIKLELGRNVSWVESKFGTTIPIIVGFIFDFVLYLLTLIYSGIILLNVNIWVNHTILIFTAINLLLHYSKVGLSLFIIRLILWLRPLTLRLWH
jgi:hypothetical protein